MLKEIATQETCDHCGLITRHRVVEWYCDHCGVLTEGHYIRFSVWLLGHQACDSEDREFCSWACAVSHLSKLENVDFLGWPTTSTSGPPGCRLEDLWALLQGAEEESGEGGGS